MSAYEKHIQPRTASTPLSAFLMCGNFSANTGGGYNELGNFKKGQFSHRRTRNADEMSSCASFLHLNELFESSASHANHLKASEKYEFKAKNKVISTRLKSQGLRRKHIEQCGNIIPQVEIYVEHCGNLFAQVGKYTKHCGNVSAHFGKCLEQRRNSSAQVGKYAEQGRNIIPQVGIYTEQRRNSFAQVEKYTKHCGNVSTQVGIYIKQHGNSSALFGMCIKQHGNIIRHLDRLGDQTVIEPVEITAACLRQQNTHKMEVSMKEIQQISVSHMANAAHFMFVSNMADRAEKDATVAEKCKAQVAALRSAVTAEDENLQISAKSLTTDKIVEADRLRDQLYAGYKKAVAGYTNFPVESLAEAAKVLAQHIKDYKIDVKAQLDKETGLLVNFIQDLESKFAEQVEALSLTAFVEKLKAANEDVRALTGQRTDERSAKTAGALKAARVVSDEAYKMLVLHVNAHAVIEGEEAYAAFIDYANTEIEHFKQKVLK